MTCPPALLNILKQFGAKNYILPRKKVSRKMSDNTTQKSDGVYSISPVGLEIIHFLEERAAKMISPKSKESAGKMHRVLCRIIALNTLSAFEEIGKIGVCCTMNELEEQMEEMKKLYGSHFFADLESH